MELPTPLMSTHREQFLQNIRDNLARAMLPQATPAHPGSFKGYTYQADAPTERLIEDFTRELQALSGHVHPVTNEPAVVTTILEILGAHQAGQMIAWAEAELGQPGLLAALAQAGVTVVDSQIPADPAGRQARLAELDPVKVGLTGAHGGLADTGSLAVISGPGRGRLVSLLTPVHIALLPAQKLYPSLPAFLAAHPTAASEGSNLVLITGPSRTADIELTLSMGVHGPKEIHVIITGV